MNGKSSFILYFGYRKHLALLNDEDRGRLIMALFDYAENGKVPDFDGAIAMAFSFIQDQMDRDASKYAAVCERNRENGAKGGRPPKTTGTQRNPLKPKKTERFSAKPKKPERFSAKPKKPDDDNDIDNDIEYDNESEKKDIGAAAPAPAKIEKHKHGEYGWVKLSDDDYERLIKDFGEPEVKRLIQCVDEYAQSTGNKQRYKDWNLVVRKAQRDGWGNRNNNAIHNHADGTRAPELTGFKSAFDDLDDNEFGGQNQRRTSNFRPSTGFRQASLE